MMEVITKKIDSIKKKFLYFKKLKFVIYIFIILSLLAIRYLETIHLLTVKAVKNEVINPTQRVTAKPFTGPFPK